MKPLHSQRIKQGQRILLISEKQTEEGVGVVVGWGLGVWGWGGGVGGRSRGQGGFQWYVFL